MGISSTSRRLGPRGTVVAMLATGALALSACSSSGGSGGTSSAADTAASGGGGTTASSGGGSSSGQFLVGTVQSLSGSFGAVGSDILHAVQAEADILNKSGGILGKQIKVVSADDGSDVQRGITATQQMIKTQKLDMFIPDAVNAQSQLPFAKNMLSFSNCSQAVCGDGKQFPLAFTTNPPSSVQVPPLIAYAKQKGWTKVGMLAQDTSDGHFFGDQVKDQVQKAGLDLVDSEYFDPTATNITSQIQKLRAAGANVIMGWTVGTTVGVAANGLRDLGWKVPLIGPPAIFTAPVNELVPSTVAPQITCICYLVGTRSGDTLSPVTQPLADAMQKYGKINSLLVAALAADGLVLAKYGFDKAGSDNSQAAAKAIEEIGADSSFPASQLYVFNKVNPDYHGTTHSPADAKLNNGFFASANPSPLVDGTYIGQPFNY